MICSIDCKQLATDLVSEAAAQAPRAFTPFAKPHTVPQRTGQVQPDRPSGRATPSQQPRCVHALRIALRGAEWGRQSPEWSNPQETNVPTQHGAMGGLATGFLFPLPAIVVFVL